jgi:hypothetical protein
MSQPLHVAVFVSPHGYGHAARACAVMEALAGIEGNVRFEIFTRVPKWFFTDSLTCQFAYHEWLADVGVVQATPFVEDLDETLRRLHTFLPFAEDELDALAELLGTLGCRVAVCDISPLGLAAARRAGIPSVLIENFTWDWIYEPYVADRPAFASHVSSLADVFEGATLRIQTEPVCRHDTRFASVPPVSRAPRAPAARVRERLGVPAGARMVLVTMGGVPWKDATFRRPDGDARVFLVVPGGSERLERRGSFLLLPHRCGFFHPDLVHASDAVVGKLGYSTLAEVFAAGVPFGWVGRPNFRESAPLASFAQENIPAIALTPDEIAGTGWLGRLAELLALPRLHTERANGARAAAAIVRRLLDNQ